MEDFVKKEIHDVYSHDDMFPLNLAVHSRTKAFKEGGMSEFIKVARLADLEEDRGTTIQVKGRLIALFLQADNVYAIDDCCPHMGASLASGYVCEGVVMCPWHAWRFRITDGAWVDAPSSGTKVKSYSVNVADGDVLLDVDW